MMSNPDGHSIPSTANQSNHTRSINNIQLRPNSASHNDFPPLPQFKRVQLVPKRSTNVTADLTPQMDMSTDNGSWITPQKQKKRYQYKKRPGDRQIEESQYFNLNSQWTSLTASSPPTTSNYEELLLDISPHPPQQNITSIPETQSQLPSSQPKPATQPTSVETLIQPFLPLIRQLLPFIIKVLLADSLSNKVKCTLELGSFFDMETNICSVLNDLGLNSLVSSQS
jgi:hypothetical protein